MTRAKSVLSKIALFNRLKSVRTSAALILTTLMLMVAAATTVATAQTFTDLYDFDGPHGLNPMGVLAQGRDGNLYGTTDRGGDKYSHGVVFKITPNGELRVLHTFTFGPAHEGSNPMGGLTLRTDVAFPGDFYGTTHDGGYYSYGPGTIFTITPSGSLTTIQNFNVYDEGSHPRAAPIQGTDENFYGTMESGLLYGITPSGAFTLLASPPGKSEAPLVEGTDGNFYGTTYDGGVNGLGTVFKMTPKGVVTILHSFDGTHGSNPTAPVIQGSDGNFYGTTSTGGVSNEGEGNWGTIFKITPHGAFMVLHNTRANDGVYPHAGLVQATDGNFYGVTSALGPGPVRPGVGTIFQITPAGAYSVLHSFDYADGTAPQSTPIQHTNGKIYGLTVKGGSSDGGVVYSLDVGLGPFVRLLSTSGGVGRGIGVLGQGFIGTTDVSFDGTPATFTVTSDTYLWATVPDGATSGFVTVTTPSGTLQSNQQFRVTPKILSFSPPSGPVGTTVVITGTSFTQATKVGFCGALTSFTVDSDTQVTAIVPAVAPQTGYIEVITPGGQAMSLAAFTVTP